MSTAARKPRNQVKPDRKVTEFFSRSSGSSVAPSSSQIMPSSPPQQETTQLKSKAGQSSKAGESSKQAKASAVPPRMDQEVISVSSGESHITVSSDSVQILATPSKNRGRAFMSSVEIISPSPRKSERTRTSRLRESKVVRKLSQTPEVQLVGASRRATPKPPVSKSVNKKRKKSTFDSDSDIEPLDTVVRVQKPQIASTLLKPKENIAEPPLKSKAPRRTSPRKKTRFTSPILIASESGELVPSSQSDEQELAMPPRIPGKNPQEVKESVSKWQETVGASAPTDFDSYGDADTMDVDEDVPVPSGSGRTSLIPSEYEVSLQLQSNLTDASNSPLTPSSAFPSRSVTPPTSNSPGPLPTTPVALDPESKAAQIIAEIKARAYQASASSADEKRAPLEFRELEESSSDDDELDVFAARLTKGKEQRSTTQKNDDPFTSQAGPSSTRYNLRTRDPSPSPVSSTSSRPSGSNHRPRRSVQSRQPFVLSSGMAPSAGRARKPKKTADPFEALLREKNLADKRGKGMDALRLAEDAVAGKDSMRMEMDDEGYVKLEEQEDWEDEEAAQRAVQEGRRLGESSSPGLGTSEPDHLILGEEEQKRLGLKGGTEIRRILQSDQETVKEKDKDKILGLALWSEDDGDDDMMDVDGDGTAAISPAAASEYPIVGALRRAIERGDIAQAALVIGSGIFVTLNGPQLAEAVPCLFEVALAIRETSASSPAFHALMHIWNASSNAPGLSSSDVLSVLLRLGAKTSVFEEQGWAISTSTRGETIESPRRTEILYSLVALITACARASRLSATEAPDILLALVLIALDPTTSADLSRDIAGAVEAICRSLGPSASVVNDAEVAVCTKLQVFARRLTPVNKAHVVSFFSAGSARARRIAQWLACSLLIEDCVISSSTYNARPPLAPLTHLLTPPPGSNALFDIQSSTDKTDYENLGHYVSILGAALYDIDGYVDDERRNPHATAGVSQITTGDTVETENSRGEKDKPLMPLQVLHRALETIHGKIVDTRAAHLDRSRTKAALQRLSMRVYYQRNSALKSGVSGRGGRPRKVTEYFGQRS